MFIYILDLFYSDMATTAGKFVPGGL